MKRKLEVVLESLEGFKNPKIELEQYVTPPKLAAFIVTNAKLLGDLNTTVVDLGCGTGILSIASSLLGAYSVGFDIDCEAVKIAKRNAKRLGVDVDFVVSRIEDVFVKEKVTTVMNPPFGIHRRHADKPFLQKAFEISDVIYTIHCAGSEKFVKSLAKSHGFEITHLWRFLIPLKKTYSFHEKPFRDIAVEVFRLKRRKGF